ncbi:T9SS type A sorting domain-containing protein [Carboxylicivirga sediminis]|uniref:T9SS type A sorting domain-containing protein n=1 Tax=Carboxylicivirga sediminis TaxID=2006564 RepID=A0A941J0M5_9BACT|nr:T9SS type A sorting domain-containing protein [Carboxylicivirga sediminis]MBR8538124.1 T9SS type A sorting domain-containing protein [Carboxylicivirga sediminis]
MKRILLLTAIVMAFSLVIDAQTIVWEDNFDSYTVPADLSEQGYAVWEGTATAADAAANNVTAVSGSNVAKCSSGSSVNIYLRKTIQLEGGKQYTYSASTMQADGKKHMIQVVVDGETLKVEGFNTTWETKSITFTPSITQEVVLTTYMWFSGFTMYVDDMKLVQDTPTAISKTSTTQLVVSPNPSTGLFKVKADEAIAAYSVYNAAGQVVKSAKVNQVKELTIDLTGHNDGLYMVQVESDKGAKTVSKLLLK